MIRHLVTHSGSFHADDLFAAATLRRLNPEATLTRTRDAETLRAALDDPETAVFDVGAEYDPERCNFDHHQAGFDVRRPNGVPYSSFGLIWRRWGGAWCADVLDRLNLAQALDPDEVAALVDQSLIEGIDAADNGELALNAHLRHAAETRLNVHSLGVMFNDFNPPAAPNLAAYDHAFGLALPVASAILEHRTIGACYRIQARALIRTHDDGTPYLVLPRPIRWFGETLAHHRFVVYPTEDGNWMVQAVPYPDRPMVPMCPFPETWAGHRDVALDAITGYTGTVFCHLKRFIAGARTRETALSMARDALDASV